MTVIINTIHGLKVCCKLERGAYKLGTETLIRETPTHYYTMEAHTVRRKYYQIGYGRSWDCTVHASREEAEKQIHRTAMLWHWKDETKCYIIERETQDTIMKNHRWKKG